MKKILTQDEMIQKALYAIDKNLDHEELKYCDEMYGYESQSLEVWQYVKECKLIGTKAFSEKYNVTY